MAEQPFTVNIGPARQQLDGILAQMGAARAAALEAIITDAEAQTKERFVPVRDGHLQASITGTVDDDGLGATLQTSGIAYAIPQETNHEFRHPDPGPTGERGADYIGRGIREAAGRGAETIAAMHGRLWR